VARALIGILALAGLPGCAAASTGGGQVCGTVGTTVEAGTPASLVPPPGYAFVDVDAPRTPTVALGSLARMSAELFARYANRDLPGVVTGVSVRYVLVGDIHVGAPHRVCSSNPMVLRVFQVDPAIAPALDFWKIEITGFSGTPFRESDLIYDNHEVARTTGRISRGSGPEYLWLHGNALYLAYGQNTSDTTTFVAALLAEQSTSR
jgi:hypothetical protein